MGEVFVPTPITPIGPIGNPSTESGHVSRMVDLCTLLVAPVGLLGKYIFDRNVERTQGNGFFLL